MAERLDVVILGERGLGDILQRLAGRIGEQVEMEPHQPAGALVDNMGTAASATQGMGQAPPLRRSRPGAIHSPVPNPETSSTVCESRERDRRLRAFEPALLESSCWRIAGERISPGFHAPTTFNNPLRFYIY